VKNTIDVPSLSRLSPSISTLRRRGTPRVRNSPIIATGSVAAISAPNTSAWRRVKSRARPKRSTMGARMTAMTAMDATTPGVASARIGVRLCRKSERSR
jgi:hypothetical protein